MSHFTTDFDLNCRAYPRHVMFYITSTNRLTPSMFSDVFKIDKILAR